MEQGGGLTAPDPGAGRKVCLFAQYDPAGRLLPHVIAYLRQLRDCGYAVHLAASGLENLDDAGAAALRSMHVAVHVRPNVGHDFGAWRDLLRSGAADGAAQVLLANDSVFGPVGQLAPLVSRMEAQGLDVWGMVESRELGWHLQSWFLNMTAEALGRLAVQRVFDQPFEAMTKPEIVVRGELALGAAFQAEGLRCGAVAPDLSSGLGWWLLPVNPMHFSWRRLLLREGVPFVKADLLRENKSNIGWADGWRGALMQVGYPVEWIDAALTGGASSHITPVRARTFGERVFQFVMSHDRLPALKAALRPNPRAVQAE